MRHQLIRLIFLSIAFAAQCSHSIASYTLVDLGTLGGGESKAFAISESGTIAGYSTLPDGNYHAFYWDGTIRDLGSLPNKKLSFALDLDEIAQVFGPSYNLGEMNSTAFRWSGGALAPIASMFATAVGTDDWVAGYCAQAGTDLGQVYRACSLHNGLLTKQVTLGGSHGFAFGINSLSQIVGYSYTSGDTEPRACLWQNGVANDLGTLGGAASQAYDVNDLGQVAGYSLDASGQAHACLFRTGPGGAALERIDLGALPYGFSYAYSINNLGQVVGASGRAFLWQDGALQDLSHLTTGAEGWTLLSATDINDAGQIAGWGRTPDGQFHAFLLQPPTAGIAAAKRTPDGLPTAVADAIISAVFDGFFYIEQADRAAGIRVDLPAHGLSAGQSASVAGIVRTNTDGERYIDASVADPVGVGAVTALAMRCSSTGGSDNEFDAGSGTGQRGVTGGTGLNNVGLLVRTWGLFERLDGHSFTLRDGSGVTLTCTVPDTLPTDPGWTFVEVSGISSIRKSGVDYIRLLRVPAVSDITPL